METSLYTNEVAQILHAQPWPKTLKWAVVEYRDRLALRFYRKNFEQLSGEDRVFIAAGIKQLFEALRSDGVPIFLEAVDDDESAQTAYVPGFGHVKGS